MGLMRDAIGRPGKASIPYGVVVNPNHPDAMRISVGPETPLALDRRLFRA